MAAPYYTVTEMVSYYGETRLEEFRGITITSSGTPAVYACAELNQILIEASDVIESWLGVRYDVPLSATPGIVQRYCRSIAYYELFVSRTQAGIAPKDVEALYKEAIDWLKAVAKGGEGAPVLDVDVSGADSDDSTKPQFKAFLTRDDQELTDGKGTDGDSYDDLSTFRLRGGNSSA